MPGVVQDEQVHLGATLTRAAPTADGTVFLSPGQEIQLDPTFRLSVSDQVVMVLGAGARLPPEAPRHGVQQCGLAVAVGSAQAGHVNPAQVQRRHVVSVA